MSTNTPSILLLGTSRQIEGLSWRSQERLSVGRRSPEVDVALMDGTVSSRHAEIWQRSRAWFVRDLGSTNGTFVNDYQISQGINQPLHDNDQLQFGDVVVTVRLEEGEPDDTEENTELIANHVIATPAPDNHREKNIKATQGYLRVEAASQKTWEEAVEGITPPSGQGPWQVEHVRALLRTGRCVCDVGSLDEMLKSVLEDVVNVLRAQRGSILLADEATGELKLRRYVASRTGLQERVTYSRTLADRSFSRRESLLCADVRKQDDLSSAQSVLSGAMSSIICALLRTPRRTFGVIHLDRGHLQVPFSRMEFQLADAIAASLSVGIESAFLVEREREQYVQTVAALGRAVEIRDSYTANHTTRVTEYSVHLAEALDLPRDAVAMLRIGTPLHDIGKIGIEDAILRKSGRLTDAEYEEMKKHTIKGALILETVPTLRDVVPIARHHHERWDGNGYPDGLSGENVSQLARIVAVADVFDALTSDRPYRDAMTLDEAFALIEKGMGTHFDPNCARAFLRIRAKIEKIHHFWQEDKSELIRALR